MKTCQSCQTENPQEAKFCKNCGTRFVTSVQKTSASGINTEAADAIAARSQTESTTSPLSSASAPSPASHDIPFTAAASGNAVPNSAVPNSAVPYQASPQAFASEPTPTMQYSIPSSAPSKQTANQHPAPTPGQTSTRPNAFTLMMSWLWESFKHPSIRRRIPAWWAIVPVAINALLVGATVFAIESHQYSAVSSLTSGFNSLMADVGSSYSVASSVPVAQLFKTAILFFLFLYVVISITFAGIRILGDTSVNFSQLHDELGQKLTPLIAVNCCALLAALLGLHLFAGVLMSVALVFIVVTPSARIAQATNYRKLDKTWMWGIASVVAGLVICIAIIILMVTGAAEVLGDLF